MQNAYSKLCEIESALANSNIPEAQRILAEAKGAVGDDGISVYTYECTKCKNTRPCKLVIPFSVIDTKMCVDGSSEGDFKLVEQHQNIVKEIEKADAQLKALGESAEKASNDFVELGKKTEESEKEVSLPL